MQTLTKEERRAARALGVSFKDVHRTGANCYGTVYGLYNNYYLVEMTFNGYSKREIYRALLRRLFDVCGLVF